MSATALRLRLAVAITSSCRQEFPAATALAVAMVMPFVIRMDSSGEQVFSGTSLDWNTWRREGGGKKGQGCCRGNIRKQGGRGEAQCKWGQEKSRCEARTTVSISIEEKPAQSWQGRTETLPLKGQQLWGSPKALSKKPREWRDCGPSTTLKGRSETDV